MKLRCLFKGHLWMVQEQGFAWSTHYGLVLVQDIQCFHCKKQEKRSVKQ